MSTTNQPFFEALQKAGLNDKEVEVYLYLLEHGKTGILELIKNTKNKRGNLYHILYSLRDQNLVEQSTEKGKLHFALNDPHYLRDLLDKQRQQLTQSTQEVEAILPDILSQYTLTSHKPNVAFYEGKEALEKILGDSLTATEEILQITDSESFDQYLTDEDASYVKKRLKMGLKKRMLIGDSPANRAFAAKQTASYHKYTEIRFLQNKLPRFKTSQLIYNDKISYQTLQPESMIGVILEDPLISLMHRSTFEVMWQQALSLSQLLNQAA